MAHPTEPKEPSAEPEEGPTSVPVPSAAPSVAPGPAGRAGLGPDPVTGAGITLLGIFLMGAGGARDLHWVFDFGVLLAVVGAVTFVLCVALSAMKQRGSSPSDPPLGGDTPHPGYDRQVLPPS